MNIVVYDKHCVITDSLVDFYKNTPDYRVIATFKKSADILHFLKTKSVDIIITELLTDEELGTELIFMLRNKAPNSLIVIYSAISFDTIKENCLASGADICVRKTGHTYKLHQTIAEHIEEVKMKPKLLPTNKISILKLTKKERIIIECMLSGLSSQEIAEKLGLSHNTINNQKNHMIKKFACNSSTELVAKLFRQGLLKI